ncbi:solute carrier 9, sub A, variant 3 [Chamberlinius hualienensis]
MGAVKLICCLNLLLLPTITQGLAPSDIKLDEKAKTNHRIDSLNLLVYVFLLILTVVTIWAFKHKRARYLHETGLAVIYGLIVGAIIRYAGEESSVSHLRVVPANSILLNSTLPPDTLWLEMLPPPFERGNQNKTYAYIFRGEIVDAQSKMIDQKATFDSEIFFNILLPPIIFTAGYSLKRRYFFRNLGAIMTFAMIGTTISCFATAAIMYGFVQLMPHLNFSFNDCLYFGAIISATDPVTVLAIFHDLHVDVNVYALVFGESVLNDVVAIALSSSIQNYEEKYMTHSGGGFESSAFFQALGSFLGLLCGSFAIGASVGCCTAILTKYTKVQEFPLLETALFVLASYSSFLMAEAADLTGIVAVLFCGICQAHYTYNNLSPESRLRTKQLFELLNFLAENFIFSYIGVSMFTFPKHRWDAGFVCSAFLAIGIARAFNIYPLSFLLNLGRNPKIQSNCQHMLFFSGLRGAMAFALAIRNTLSVARQTMLTTTSIIVMVTVIICGGLTTQLLSWLGIPVGVDEDHDTANMIVVRTNGHETQRNVNRNVEKAWLVRIWCNFDVKLMKPLLTHCRPTLLETLPVCCTPLARLLTTSQQLSQPSSQREDDSDIDLCIDDLDVNCHDFPPNREESLSDARPSFVTVDDHNFM